MIVLALLGVLAFLALDFASKSSLSRTLSRSGLALTKATLSARSGLEKGVQAIMTLGRLPEFDLPFGSRLSSAGEDRNRNGILDPGEDVDGDGLITTTLSLERDLTPSLAVPEPGLQRSLVVQDGGVSRGVTWRNSDGDQYCSLRITVPSIDLNAGVEAGRGPEGQRYAADNGFPYSASNKNHPFNIPFLRFLNSWGNYHKYKAMIRPGRTYNFNRSTSAGLIDSPDNLSSSQAESEHPINRFDDFNPSGNYEMDQNSMPISTETPLGECLLNARPAEGFRSMEAVLPVVEAYLRSWTDKAGRHAVDDGGPGWLYADGSPIPRLTEARIKAIVNEFKDLAALEPDRDPSWVFKRGIPSPADSNDSPIPGYFENHSNRHYLYTHVYVVPALRVDVTRAPESVLAALVQAPGNVQLLPFNRSMGRMDIPLSPIPMQSENNHPSIFSYLHEESFCSLIRGKPLFSMTESIQMARELILKRRKNHFQFSMSDFRDVLRSWRSGYDAKYQHVWAPDHQFNTVVWSRPVAQFDMVDRFYDFHHGHRRVQILAELLNPHVNDVRVVWDEALSQGVDNKKNRLIMAPDNPSKGIFFQFDETNDASSEKGPEVCFQSRVMSMSSLGWTAPNGEKRMLSTRVRLFERMDIGTQKDFIDTGYDPNNGASSLGSWVSYPELPSVNVIPCEWTGHLALKPSTFQCPWGHTPRLRVKLNGYEPSPTDPVDSNGTSVKAWPKGPRGLQGPSALPARGAFRNSLNPAPQTAITSLYPSQSDDIDEACDLMPGGGIRMSPWNNSPMRAINGMNWYNSREALLVLRNALVEDSDDDQLPNENYQLPDGQPSMVLPHLHEGAISFYVKPRFLPEFSHVPTPTAPSGGVATLFFMPFSVMDKETEQRCVLSGMSLGESLIRSQFVGSLRLTWSQYNPFGDDNKVYDQKPRSDFRWPAVANFGGVGAFPGQVDAGPFYFSSMEGFEDIVYDPPPMGFVMTRNMIWPSLGGSRFFGDVSVASGDGIQGHWRVPNPYSNEMIVLEWDIHKMASNQEVVSERLYASQNSVTNMWGTWDSSDGFKDLAYKTSYLQPPSIPLYLYDDSDLNHKEYHSVRKCFYLQGPKMFDNIAMKGRGPTDSRGDLQALVETGRWNHFFIGWRNLYAVLGNSPPTMGGSLCVYINGSFRKTAPLGFETGSIFFNFDSSPAYRGFGAGGVNSSSWDPDLHSIYQQSFLYWGPLRRIGGYAASKTFAVPCSQLLGGAMSRPIYPSSPPMLDMGIGIEPSMYPYYSNDTVGILPEYAEHSPRKMYLHQRFPPRFYFGFEPHTISCHSGIIFDSHSYFPSNITWASFMDIQIFDSFTDNSNDSPLAADGGFLPELPNYFSSPNDGFTPYPNLQSAQPASFFPLLKGAWASRVVGHMDLVGISMVAQLPEFHKFWDDQNPGIAGADALDAQQMSVNWYLQGNPIGTLNLSQVPGTAPRYQLECKHALNQGLDAMDLYGEVNFSGPHVVFSTPLIESFELTFMRRHPQYESILME